MATPKLKSAGAEVPFIDMTPMIDIVFQLLAFFMMIMNFENTNADERVKLPNDQLAKPPEAQRKNDLLLNVGFIRDASGQKQSGALVFYAGEDVAVDGMLKHLQTEARLFKDKGTDLKDVTVVIRSDAEVPTGAIQDLIALSQKASFEKFALKATQKTDEP